MRLADKHILVTGGGGFVGLPTTKALLAEGARVRVLEIAPSGRLDELGCEVVVGDVADEHTALEASEGVDALLHLAVLPLTAANTEHARAFEANVRAAFVAFRAAGEQSLERVVYSSASSAYGPTAAVPIHEHHPLRPTAFYPATKAAAEMLLRGLAGAYGFGHAILRYMNVYGPGQRAGVVPAIARKLVAGEQPTLTGDGRQAFDFVHIDDCAQANVLALASESNGEDFNVGSGDATSLLDVATTMGELLGQRVEPRFEGEARPAPPRVGDVSKARDVLGFDAQLSLRDGLQTVLDDLGSAQPVTRADDTAA